MKREAFALVVCLMSAVVSFPAQAQVSFSQPPTYAGTGTVFVADFNGDGKPDILMSDGTMNLGNGDGTFKLGTSLKGSSVPVLAVADFNGDGQPDVLELSTGTLVVLLGNGDGTFQAAIDTGAGATLSVVAAGDLNGDGKADVVGVSGSSLFVYISRGDGTFAAGVSYNIGATAGGFNPVLSLGDFNGDKKTDVGISIGEDSVTGNEVVFLGNGDGTFQTTPKTSTGIADAGFAATGDFNGDGKLDLVLTQATNGCAGAFCVGSVLLGNGDGTFQAPLVVFSAPEGLGVSFGALAAADVNGDGKLDLVVNTSNTEVVQVYLGNGDGTFSNTNTYVASMGTVDNGELPATTLAIADFNGDGKVDVACLNSVLLGNGDGTFQGIELGTVPSRALTSVVGDFEKDDTPDVALVSNTYSSPGPSLSILHNNGAGILSLLHTYTLPYPLQTVSFGIVTADFNGDGKLDLIVFAMVLDSSEWGYSVLLGNGDGSFQSPIFYSQSDVGSLAFGSSSAFVVADFNNDQKPDIAFTFQGTGSNSLGILIGNGDGTFAAPVYYYDDGFLPLIVADFNGDGKLDLASGGEDPVAGGWATVILSGNGDGTFQTAVSPSSLKGFAAYLTADLNNDGKADLVSSVFANSTTPSQVALGNGDGTFTLLTALQYQVSAIADFNGDGKPDVVVTSYNGSIPGHAGVLLGNGDGTFGSFINIVTNGVLPTPTIQIADMNDDGLPDIVFPWSNGIGALLNTTKAVKPGFTLGAASGSPTSQTVTAGQTASFSLAIAPTGSFTGTVTFTCAITPVVTPAPTCMLSSSSVQISGTGTQTVTVTVGTTAAGAAAAVPPMSFPPGAMLLTWSLMFVGTLLGSTWLWVRSGKRLPALAAPVILLALASLVSCSSGSSSSAASGTPAGTYAATVTATSGSVSNNMAFQVVVQ